MSREACLKALKAEGVHVGAYSGLGNLLHTYPVFQEAQWWHHLPAVPDKMPGCDEVRRTGHPAAVFHLRRARTRGPVRQGVREGLGAPAGTDIGIAETWGWPTRLRFP